jgi:hypothetical protein
MGQALNATLEELQGDNFTPENKEARFECYQALAYDMMRAKRMKKIQGTKIIMQFWSDCFVACEKSDREINMMTSISQ